MKPPLERAVFLLDQIGCPGSIVRVNGGEEGAEAFFQLLPAA